ncbi:MAG: NAD(P)-dependent oxidoreductase, partial [Mesorhizobium sp.]
MSERRFFIFGAGYSGKAFARANEHHAPVSGTTRAPEKFGALRSAGIEPLQFDGALSPELGEALAKTTHLIVSVAPDDAGDAVLNVVGDALKG